MCECAGIGRRGKVLELRRLSDFLGPFQAHFFNLPYPSDNSDSSDGKRDMPTR